MEISNIWSSAKAQIGNAIDKNTADITSLKEKTTELEGQMSDQDRLYKVGDILNTLRGAPDDSWLECDGSGISSEDYPELCEDFGLRTTGYNDRKSATYGKDKKSIAYHNGKCLVNRSGTSLLYSSDISHAEWSEITISSRLTYTINGVMYNDGYWYAWGSSNAYSSSAQSITIFYTTNPTGTWNYQYFKNTDSVANDMAIYDGTLVAVGSKGSNPLVTYLDISSGHSSSTGLAMTLSTATGYLKSVVCCNGTWVAAGDTKYGYGRADGKNRYLLLYTATDPTSSANWTENTNINRVVNGQCFDMAFYDGVCALCMEANSRGYVYYTTNPKGVWNSKMLPTSQESCGGSIMHNGNAWVVFYMNQQSSDKRLVSYRATTFDFSSEFAFQSINDFTDAAIINKYGASTSYPLCAYEDSSGLHIYHIEGTDGNNGYDESTIFVSTRKALPKISLSSECNTYIKAK